ncbi:hypothetical protein BST20_26905 [Mycobacterium branderi]|uniref:Uncharacterized protein n=1 Tax=Mycobacterium branderi TaxID=43348 RepID=A0AA91RFG8_9MYCO|nr:hypothetical protein BST20_26905 [Mycobacterium branderi]
MQQLLGHPEYSAYLAPGQSDGTAGQDRLLVAGPRTFQGVAGIGEFTHAVTAENVRDHGIRRSRRQRLPLVELALELR